MKKFGILILAATALFAFSCKNLIEEAKEKTTTGTLVFDTTVSRSAFPTVTEDTFTNVVLKGKLGSGTEQTLGTWDSISAMKAAKVGVKLGSWTFTLTAKKGDVEFEATTTATVAAGTNVISFELKNKSWGTGNGGITATLIVPETVKKATFTLKKLSDNSTVETKDVTTGTPTNGKVSIAYTKSGLSAASQYDLSVKFYGNGDTLLNEVSEVFTVGTGLTSTWTEEFTDLTSIYSITYNTNGGTINGNYSQYYTAKTGAITLPVPTWNAYHQFDGWFENENCTGTAVTTIAADSTGNKVFYAKWLNITPPPYVPLPNAENVFEDTRLFISFDEDCSPALGSGTIKIYEQGNSTAIDTIKIGGEITYDKNATPKTTNVSAEKITISGKELNVKNFLVQVYKKQLVIIPHAALSNNKTYIVEVPASAVTNAKIDGTTFAGTTYAGAEWKFKTRASYTPSNKSAIRVGTSSAADYATVQKAIDNANDNATITLEKGVYHEIIRSQKNLKIVGDTNAEYGNDVVIRGINVTTWNPSTHDRAVFYQNNKSLVLKNLTIENAYTRNMMNGQSEHQAEAIYFANGNGKTLAVYNCSFKSYQDTIQTSGRNWFYKCYIEGDTDFIWGTADVCLVEESKLVALSDSSYFMVSRTGNTTAETVAKGYVALNCDFEIKAGSSYFGRNPGGSGFYDQVAIINPKVSGTLNSALWKSSGSYSYYEDASAIGWKVYNVKNASGNAISTSSKLANTAVISSDVYSKEYNGRDTILNRVYNKTAKKYVAGSTSTKWDVSSLETEFNATTDASKNNVYETVTATKNTYDFTKASSSTVGNLPCDEDENIKITTSGASYHGTSYGFSGSNVTMTFPVTGACKIYVYPTFKGTSGTLTLKNGSTTVETKSFATDSSTESKFGGGTEQDPEKWKVALDYTGSAGTLTLTMGGSGTFYCGKVVVDYTGTGGTTPSDPIPTNFDFTKVGTVNLTLDDLKGFGSHEGNTGSYRGISLDATTGKWGPRDSDIQVNAGVKMSFTVAKNTTEDDITVSFTAAAGDQHKPTVEKSVSGTTATLTFGAGYPSTMTVVIAAPSGSGGGGATIDATWDFTKITSLEGVSSDGKSVLSSDVTVPVTSGSGATLKLLANSSSKPKFNSGLQMNGSNITDEVTATNAKGKFFDVFSITCDAPCTATITAVPAGDYTKDDNGTTKYNVRGFMLKNDAEPIWFMTSSDTSSTQVSETVSLVQGVNTFVGSGMKFKTITCSGTSGGSSGTEKTLSSISITTQPTIQSYTVGDTLNLNGLVVKATYSDSSTKNVTGYTCSPADGATLSTAGTQTVNVSYTESGVTRTTSFTVSVAAASSGGNTISVNDSPLGFASIDAATNFGGKGGTAVRVTTAAKFKEYAESSTAYIIYVDGMIDLSGGMLPTTAGGSTDDLDSFVVTKTASYEGATDSDTDTSKYYKFTSYSDFKTKYAKSCNASSDDKTSSSPKTVYGKTLWKLNSDYQAIVKVNVNSNKTIIGVGSNSGLKGGTLNISSKNNIAIRNMTLQDAYDPFPHHEKDDGFNAELDCIVVQGSSYNIWIDHCTLKDTLYASNVSISGGGSEKWQTFDGLCDIKGSTKNVTVSNCYFYDHDKTMLIGSSDTDGSNATRTVTLVGNYFHNCGQRLPMVRNTRLHAYNNYYYANNPHYTQQYAIGVRSAALIFAENNYFEGIKYAYKDGEHSKENNGNGSVYHTGDGGTVNESFTGYADEVSEAPFTPTYDYAPMTAAAAKTYATTNAGAGKWTVSDTIPTN